jgi:acrylyl-CoA reductase (NADPH)
MEEAPYLTELGAEQIVPRVDLSGDPKPLAKERWIAGVDSVGSRTLANVLASTSYGGAVAACGLAGGMDLPTSVAPFILRGVSLLGIDSVQMPMPRRLAAWNRLARDLDVKKLAAMTRTIGLADVRKAAADILAGRIRGRVVVEIP